MSGGITFTIDQKSIAAIIDQDEKKAIGTAFVFIKAAWAVTAKHVVLRAGDKPRSIQLQFVPGEIVSARIAYVHPLVDLAVLEVPQSPCRFPLFPAHHGFAGGLGLVAAGYAPSKSNNDSRSIVAHHIPSFQIEKRERSGLTEEVVVFESALTESGFSGGPVLGLGGGVVGVVIENWETGSRATSVKPLLDKLGFVA